MEKWNDTIEWPFYPSEDGKALKRTNVEHEILTLGRYKPPFYLEGYVYWFKDNNLVRKPVPSKDVLLAMSIIQKDLYTFCISLRPSKSQKTILQFISDLEISLQRFPIKEILGKVINKERVNEVRKAMNRLKTVDENIKRKIKELDGLYEQVTFFK